MDSVWCGDALFVNRRLDALTLLAAVAGRTERVLLGPACMGSFALRDPLVFAYEWASLDVLSNGRTRLVACSGGGAGPLWEAESAAMGIAPEDRRKRMVENMHVLRHLWTRDNEPFEGKFVKFSNITLEPKPVQTPCPIWLATNAERLSKGQADFGGSEFALTRVGRIADGWMTHSVSRKASGALGFHPRPAAPTATCRARQRPLSPHQRERRQGRRPGRSGNGSTLLFGRLRQGAPGSLADLRVGADCIAQLARFKASGCRRITFRISTMGDPMEQFRRVVGEVLPHVGEGTSPAVPA
jgi:alkanesulfonate monooxygenase SsuD/methylene tetrahydromethanopterin reductase-like flavin-dependent oxidoreductase (luciferase family)